MRSEVQVSHSLGSFFNFENPIAQEEQSEAEPLSNSIPAAWSCLKNAREGLKTNPYRQKATPPQGGDAKPAASGGAPGLGRRISRQRGCQYSVQRPYRRPPPYRVP